MEALSGDNTDEYFKAMDDEIKILMRRDTWYIVSRKSVTDQNVLPETWYFKCKDETWLENKEIKGTVLCEKGYQEDIVS